MNRNTLFFLFAGLLFIGCKETPKEGSVDTENAVIQREGNTMPLYEDLEGNPVAIAGFKGKRVLLNFWATWCGPCIEEMPDLLELQSVLAAENYIFLFASDESVQKIKKFKSTSEFDFKFIKYNGTHAQQKIYALPVTLIYNEVGEEILRFDGAMPWNTKEMIEKLQN